jgi:SAM-dependent methyltransferase
MQRRQPDPHVLYEAAVQGVDFDLDLMETVYRRLRGRRFQLFREDFCGTGQMAGAWVLRRPENRAWGVDLDAPTLAWAREHRLRRMGKRARRLRLVRADVRAVTRPQVDVVAAFNYSYWVFKQRAQLLRYFRGARRSLRKDGLFFVTAFAGTQAMGTLVERTRIPVSYDVDGNRVPPYTYIWEQKSFNALSHDILCYIHFRLGNGKVLRRAFTYDWRMWTMPEVKDALLEAGFRDVLLYVDGWNDRKGRPDDFYRLRTRLANQECWLSIIVGVT